MLGLIPTKNVVYSNFFVVEIQSEVFLLTLDCKEQPGLTYGNVLFDIETFISLASVLLLL